MCHRDAVFCRRSALLDIAGTPYDLALLQMSVDIRH